MSWGKHVYRRMLCSLELVSAPCRCDGGAKRDKGGCGAKYLIWISEGSLHLSPVRYKLVHVTRGFGDIKSSPDEGTPRWPGRVAEASWQAGWLSYLSCHSQWMCPALSAAVHIPGAGLQQSS